MTDTDTLGKPLHERLTDLKSRILQAVPPIYPPGCHWLNSDSGLSYCWPCAREAAWRELPTIGPAPVEVDWWHRDPQERLIRDRIDGPSWGESDNSEACTTCNCTLEYLLTESGVDDELAHYAENPILPGETIDGERTYELERLLMNLDWSGADDGRMQAGHALAEAAMTAIEHQKTPVEMRPD